MSEEKPQKRRWRMFSQPLSGELDRILKPIYKEHGFSEHRLLTEWANVVGKDLARCSIPRRLTFPRGKREHGVLHVGVLPARALELQHMLPIIIERIAAYFGYPAVEKIMFIQDASLLTRKPKTKKLPAAGVPVVEEVVATCKDDELRRALSSLGAAIHADKHA